MAGIVREVATPPVARLAMECDPPKRAIVVTLTFRSQDEALTAWGMYRALYEAGMLVLHLGPKPPTASETN